MEEICRALQRIDERAESFEPWAIEARAALQLVQERAKSWPQDFRVFMWEAPYMEFAKKWPWERRKIYVGGLTRGEGFLPSWPIESCPDKILRATMAQLPEFLAEVERQL